MLARLDVERPEVAEAIAQRIERQEFDVIALINPLARSRFWYTDIHLGPTVSTAICKAYRQSGTVGGQMLYTPRTRNLASATLASCFDQ